MKLNLSRAAKKFRELEPKEAVAPKPAVSKKKAPVPEPVKEPVIEKVEPVVEAVPEIVEPVQQPTAQPKKDRTKPKRPRFVREKVEKRQPVKTVPLPERSSKANAKLMTKNLSVLPKDDTKSGR